MMIRWILVAFGGISVSGAAASQTLLPYGDFPSYVACLTARSTADPFPVERIFYQTRRQYIGGTLDSVKYDTIPLVADDPTRTRRFFLSFDQNGTLAFLGFEQGYTSSNCSVGMNLSDLVDSGQAGYFAMRR